jgi:hypothetical protein
MPLFQVARGIRAHQHREGPFRLPLAGRMVSTV